MASSYALTEVRPLIGDLVRRAQGGETITITRNGKPAAMLCPYARRQSRAGQLSDYFSLLISLAERTEDPQRCAELFDRIERALTGMAAECALRGEESA